MSDSRFLLRHSCLGSCLNSTRASKRRRPHFNGERFLGPYASDEHGR